MEICRDLSSIIKNVKEIIGENKDELWCFRGESKDYEKTALMPKLYRNLGYINNEHIIYRESQRFNEQEFLADKTAFDKLSRMQHYGVPTRLLDMSEDIFSAIYFAVQSSKEIPKEDKVDDDRIHPRVYLFKIESSKIKYYDSDTVSVLSNMAKFPHKNGTNEKSKDALLASRKYNSSSIKEFNSNEGVKFLVHEIGEEKPHFRNLIVPEHLTSIQVVFPKLTNSRIKSQKGFFILFGLSPHDVSEGISLKTITDKPDELIINPIMSIQEIMIDARYARDIKKELEVLGIKMTYIYPELEKVSEYLCQIYKL